MDPRRKLDRLGAPKPKDGEEMTMTSQKDLEAAFGMLDEDRDGKLTKSEAINFLICAGWCLPEELDSELSDVQRSHFSFQELCEVLRRLSSSKTENLSVAQLTTSLLYLADNESLGLEHLNEVVCTGEKAAMSPEELENVLDTLGVFDESVDCPELAKRILDAVCNPPTKAGAAKSAKSAKPAKPKQLENTAAQPSSRSRDSHSDFLRFLTA
ncbi:unnamed protein product [Cladocopium goreaui]|uniref:EF-hand domain-containing protein n=1 Tax=Cladocopium goreaui TaxID=2562237 RepID=A0A9P1D279_9DINO|nr:unnamed protein product [Cladocopium goreaui]